MTNNTVYAEPRPRLRPLPTPPACPAGGSRRDVLEGLDGSSTPTSSSGSSHGDYSDTGAR